MASSTAESILRQTLEAAQSAVNAQAAAVRQLKSSSSAADTAVVNAVVESLKVLKLEIDATDEQLRDLIKSCGGESKEEFRQEQEQDNSNLGQSLESDATSIVLTLDGEGSIKNFFCSGEYGKDPEYEGCCKLE